MAVMLPRLLGAVVGLVVAGMVTDCAHAVTTIDTSGNFFGSTFAPFGEPNSATYGQTFTVTGPETQLDSFTFRFDDYLTLEAPDTIDFAAYVYAWDGIKATGPQLYASGQVTSTNNGGLGGYETFSFDAGGVQLVSDQHYVAFVNSSMFFDGEIGRSTWEYNSGDANSPGRFVFVNNGSDFDLLFSETWDWDAISGYTYFIANFSAPAPIPLPAAFPLFATALAGMGLLGWRRKRKAAA